MVKVVPVKAHTRAIKVKSKSKAKANKSNVVKLVPKPVVSPILQIGDKVIIADVKATIEQETEKAFLVKAYETGFTCWFPKTAMERVGNKKFVFVLADWFRPNGYVASWIHYNKS